VSAAHPEPCTPIAAAVKCAVNLSNEPKWSSIALARSPVGLSPPSGDMLVQNTEWFTWPPRLNARSFSSLFTFARSPLSRASASAVSAAFAPVTYAWWCLEWWSSMIWPEMLGARAP
jgi:hypothetical protein